MIEIALHIALISLHKTLQEAFFRGRRLAVLSQPMRLQICLCHNIQTILIAQVIPQIVIGIMTGAHGIDIVLFHQLYVPHHALARNNITSIGV